ncbi:MAG TPA: hypothetical protein VF584_02485 [Longimicrobium sp.]|jgi:hypothetical protein
MIAHVRASIAALWLLAACSASAAAQQRQCSAADSARIGWSAPQGEAEETWRAALVSGGLIAAGAEAVHIPFGSLHSLSGSDYDRTSQLNTDLIDAIRARIGDGPSRTHALVRIEADSTLSGLMLVLPSGMVSIRESVTEKTRRLRAVPAVSNGCPMGIWYPITIESYGTRIVGRGTRQPPRPLEPEAERVGSFEVLVVRSYFTGEDQSNASTRPRSGTGGELRWWCAEGGGVWVGVTLPAAARDGETRPVEWSFDGDAPAAASLRGVREFHRWFLPDEDVARFTVRARTARRLVVRMPADGTEYQYDLEQPRQALDRLACAPGTPLAGRIPRAPEGEFTGVGRAGGVMSPPTQGSGTYEVPAPLRSPGDQWVKVFQWNEGGVDWIDTTSVSRVGKNVYRFTLRRIEHAPMRRVSDGLTFDASDDLLEFDCARIRSRLLTKKFLLWGRVLAEEAPPGRDWTREIPQFRDSYCPVLTRAQPRPLPASTNP